MKCMDELERRKGLRDLNQGFVLEFKIFHFIIVQFCKDIVFLILIVQDESGKGTMGFLL